jgi:hypothetical protein
VAHLVVVVLLERPHVARTNDAANGFAQIGVVLLGDRVAFLPQRACLEVLLAVGVALARSALVQAPLHDSAQGLRGVCLHRLILGV